MKFKIKLIVTIFVFAVIFASLTAQNAYYDALYFCEIKTGDLGRYIALINAEPDIILKELGNFKSIPEEERSIFKEKLLSGKLSEILWKGMLFLDLPWRNPPSITEFKNEFQLVELVCKKYIEMSTDKTKNYIEYIIEVLNFNFQYEYEELKEKREDLKRYNAFFKKIDAKIFFKHFREILQFTKEVKAYDEFRKKYENYKKEIAPAQLKKMLEKCLLYLDSPWKTEIKQKDFNVSLEFAEFLHSHYEKLEDEIAHLMIRIDTLSKYVRKEKGKDSPDTKRLEKLFELFKNMKVLKFLGDPSNNKLNVDDINNFSCTLKEMESLYKKYREEYIENQIKENPELRGESKKKKEKLFLEEIGLEFTEAIHEEIVVSVTKEIEQVEGTQATPGKFFNSTFQTNLIDAIGSLIAERFKEDVTIMYINKLKKELSDKKYGKTIKLLLPEIYDLVMGKDPFTYFALGKELKATFEKDLENLPKNIVKNMDKIAPKIKDNDLFPYLEWAFEISDKLIHGYHPVDVLNYLDVLYKGKRDTDENIYKVVHLLNLVQLNLQKHCEKDEADKEKKEETVGWISFSDLKKINVKYRIELFLALIYWQDKPFFDETLISDDDEYLVDWLQETSREFKDRIVPVFQIFVKINKFDKKVKGTSEDYAKYMQFTLDVLKEAYRIISDESTDEELNESTLLGFKIAQKCLDIYKSIYKKDYKNLISQTHYILKELYSGMLRKTITDSKEFKKIEELTELGKSLKMTILKNPAGIKNEEDLVQLKYEVSKKIIELGNNDVKKKKKLEAVTFSINKTISLVKNELEEFESNSKFHKFVGVLSKYGAFIEGIANAKDAKDMKKVIAAVILPRGSFLKKRTSTFSITIAAHPGIFLGRERMSNVDDITNSNGSQMAASGITASDEKNKLNTMKWSWITGFTAPLGIELCWGIKNSSCFISSHGLFLFLIDLGAVVSYRLTKSSDDYNGMPDKITFKQIFSPGASLNFGIKNSPITFRLGVQYTPELRKIREEDIILDERKSWRFFAGFSWDIPLLSITPKFKK
jgi:hypothetical protein